MKFLIAGLGSIGRRHLRNLAALGQNDILLYRTHHATLDDEELAAYPVETNLEVALAQGPDAVIIANPTALHMRVAVPAAQQGCALFIEKPLAYRPEDLAELEACFAGRQKPRAFRLPISLQPRLGQGQAIAGRRRHRTPAVLS